PPFSAPPPLTALHNFMRTTNDSRVRDGIVLPNDKAPAENGRGLVQFLPVWDMHVSRGTRSKGPLQSDGVAREARRGGTQGHETAGPHRAGAGRCRTRGFASSSAEPRRAASRGVLLPAR